MMLWNPMVAMRKYSFRRRSDGSAMTSETSTPTVEASANETRRSWVRLSASSAVT